VSQIQLWTLVFVVITFGIYIYIAYASRVSSTAGFYIAGGGIPAPANGAAIAADWMSAASFISMAGIVAFTGNGYAGSVYLMGWTGGYVLLALLLAPYLRKFGKYTIPDFVGDRYSETARLVAVVAAVVISFVYVAGQMAGVGLVFQRFLGVGTVTGVIIGMIIVFFYAVLGGMKGITWTQVAQYTVLIIAYLIPTVAISVQVTGIPVPQIGFGQILAELDGLQRDLGFEAYTEAFTQTSMFNMFLITAALMFGTAGLPHVIVRFYTAASVRAARYSALWALFFIALLYTSAPAIGAFSKLNFINQIAGTGIEDTPGWFNTWRDVGLGVAFGVGGLVVTIPASVLFVAIVGEGATSAVGEVFSATRASVPVAVLIFLIVVLLAPLCEEIVYRGLLWGGVEKLAGPRVAFAVSTLLFALAHFEFTRTPLLLVVAIPIAAARLYTGRLLASIIAHQINNLLPGVALLLALLGVVPLA